MGGMPPRPRPPDQWRRPDQEQWRRPDQWRAPPQLPSQRPLGWNQPLRRAPYPTRSRNHVAWWIAIGIVITLGAGVWFFGLRSSAPSSAFVRAYDRYSAAVNKVRSGAEQVSRFLDLPEYETLANDQVAVMRKQTKVFERLARNEDGEAGRIAGDAIDAAKRGVLGAAWFANGILDRKLTNANRANGELGAAVVQLSSLAKEWENLSK